MTRLLIMSVVAVAFALPRPALTQGQVPVAGRGAAGPGVPADAPPPRSVALGRTQ